MQIFARFPLGKVAHWRLGCFLTIPVGLNFVARVRLLYPPPIIEPFSQMKHCLAMPKIKERSDYNFCASPSFARLREKKGIK
ncbi:MAG: hypothetical protein Q8R36_04880 [bacterium]|nr:hypothetical protein [bacterium]